MDNYSHTYTHIDKRYIRMDGVLCVIYMVILIYIKI